MKTQYANEFIEKLGMGDPQTCLYRFICDEKYNVDINIIKYFIMNRLVLSIKVDSYVAHIFYVF